MTPVVIVGAGGHGRELASVMAAVNRVRLTWTIVGFVDDGPASTDALDRLGLSLLGPLSWLEAHPHAFIMGIGTSAIRRSLVDRLERSGCEPKTLVAATASVGSDVRLGPGAVVHEHTTITTNVSIGAHTHLNVGCAVQHDTVVGAFVQMSPASFVNGDCVIEDDVFLGSGAIVTRGVRVGRGARIGAGATVLHDVPPGSLVVGTPGRPR